MSTNREAPGLSGTEGPSGARTIKASEFKAKCLKLMDEVAGSGEEIVITKNGKPVAKLTPYKPAAEGTSYRDRPETPFGLNKGRYEIHGDLDDALLDVEWDAETGKNWDDLL